MCGARQRQNGSCDCRPLIGNKGGFLRHITRYHQEQRSTFRPLQSSARQAKFIRRGQSACHSTSLRRGKTPLPSFPRIQSHSAFSRQETTSRLARRCSATNIDYRAPQHFPVAEYSGTVGVSPDRIHRGICSDSVTLRPECMGDTPARAEPRPDTH